MIRIRRFARTVFRRRAFEQSMADEMRSHLEHRVDDLVRSGLPPAEARRQAQVEFGGMEEYKERARQARGLQLLDEIRGDLRYAFRTLARSPIFTLAAILSLALGIGANLSMFAVFDAVLTRPLPFHEPDRLVQIYETFAAHPGEKGDFAVANLFDVARSSRSLQDVLGYMPTGVSLSGSVEAEQVGGAMLTANAFQLLGAQAQIGRALIPSDDDPASPAAILLSHKLWMRKFGGDPAVVGRAVNIEGRSATIVGVMPAWFRFPMALNGDEFWVPSRLNEKDRQQRSNHSWWCIARLRPGATLSQVQAELQTVASRLQQDYPATNRDVTFIPMPLHQAMTGSLRPLLTTLMVAVVLVFMASCANVANLVLTRSTARQKEIAVRAAVGAGLFRLARQFLIETLLLSFAGGAAAAGLVASAMPVAGRLLPRTVLSSGSLTLDVRLMGYAFVTAIVAALVCGISPVVFLARGRWTGRRLSGESEFRLRGFLVAAEIAFASVLLIGLGLLGRSFWRLVNVDLGVRTDRVLSVQFVLPRYRYREPAQRFAFYQKLLESVKTVPGVETSGLINVVPFTDEGGSSWFTIEGYSAPNPQELIANNRLVSADFFGALSVPLRKGRWLDNSDTAEGKPVALINEAMARRFWPGQDPVGRRFKFGFADSQKPWIEVVGMVGDIRQKGPDIAAEPEMYRPFWQDSQAWLAPRGLVVRTRTEPSAMEDSVRKIIHGLDAQVPLYGVQTMDEMVSATISDRRVSLILMGVFGMVALGLAAVGIYGVAAYSAAQRTREIALRLALGAERSTVALLMLRRGFPPVALGVLSGVLLSLAVNRLLKSQLYAVSPTDPLAFLLVVAVIGAIALTASALPALRASRLDPAAALREQ
jgi:putative ABC transport system permease protein